MKQTITLSGVFPVVPTPLKEDETFDARAMGHLAEFYVSAGCHGLVALGSGGELPYFSGNEKVTILRTVLDAVQGRVPVVTGCGYVSLGETLEFMEATRSMDIAAYMVILPTYCPVSYEELYALYRTVGRKSPKPIIYYHYPQITGHFLNAERMKRLLTLDGIVGVKESTMCLPEIRRHIRSMGDNPVNVFTGTALILYEVLAMGGAGAIDPVAGIAPRLVTECYRAYASGDRQTARSLQDEILSFVPIMNTFGLPTGLQKLAVRILSHKRNPSPTAGRASRHAVIKETLRQLGHPITAAVRSPLARITPEEREAVSAFIDATPCLVRERV